MNNSAVNHVKVLLQPGLKFAGVGLEGLNRWVIELKAIEDKLRAEGCPAEGLTFPEFIAGKYEDIGIWGDIEARDWEMMQAHINKQRAKLNPVCNAPAWFLALLAQYAGYGMAFVATELRPDEMTPAEWVDFVWSVRLFGELEAINKESEHGN